MNGKAWRILVGVAALAAALSLPAAAGFGSLPVLATDTLTSAGAASYRFTVPDDSALEILVEASHENATLVGDGIWLIDPSGMEIGYVSTWTADGLTEFHLETPAPGVLYDVRPVPRDSISQGTGLLVFGLPAGTYRLVVGSISDAASGTVTVSVGAPSGTVLLDRMVSEGGFVYNEADFRGLNVVAGTPAARVVVMAGASLTETVERSMYGWFGSPFEVASSYTVAGPEGSSTAPTHFLTGPAGEYSFTVDYDIGLPNGRMWLWALDVDTV